MRTCEEWVNYSKFKNKPEGPPLCIRLDKYCVFFFSLMFASLRAGLVTGSIARVLSNEARISEPSNLASKLAGNLRLRSDASILPLTQ